MAKNDEKVIAALDTVDKSLGTLKEFSKKYNEHIDAAAIAGRDSRARELINQKLRVNALIEQLEELKRHIDLAAYTSQAFAGLSKLPAAISGCKGLLTESPNFGKLGKSITAIFKDLNRSEQEISKLNDILTPKQEETFASRLDRKQTEKVSDEFEKEYTEMIIRLRAREEDARNSSTNSNKTATNPSSGIGKIDFSGIIGDQNKKQ